MPKNAVSDWSTTAADNTDIGGINIAAGQMAVSDTDNALREMMEQIAVWYAARFTDPALTGTILEDIYTITDGAAFEIDPGNGSMQFVTLGASRTPKATNFANGEAITLFVNDGAGYSITWTDTTFGPSGIDWKDEEAATLHTTRWTAIVLFKEDGQIHGSPAGNYG